MDRVLSVTLHIPEALMNAALRAARAEDLTAGEFIRAALTERVAEAEGRKAECALVTIRRELRDDFVAAEDWFDLQRRLRARKLVLREKEDGLWLYTWPLEQRLVEIARIGQDRDTLTLRFRAEFPAYGSGITPRWRAHQAA